MPKERNYNPVQAQRKADKAKAIKKGKADLQARRNEKLANRNPERIQKQIDDLKAIKDGGKLTAHEEQALEALEKDLKAVKKAREALGDRAPAFKSYHSARTGQNEGPNVLGKRRRDDEDVDSSDSDVPEDVRRIPMPRDTPPPIPKEVLDKWYAKRRARRAAQATDANQEPLAAGKERDVNQGRWQKSESTVPMEAKTVYEAKPVLRDLKKEAVSAFMPTAVRMKISKEKGQGHPLDSEPAGREGYLAQEGAAGPGNGSMTVDEGEPSVNRRAMVEDAMDEETS